MPWDSCDKKCDVFRIMGVLFYFAFTGKNKGESDIFYLVSQPIKLVLSYIFCKNCINMLIQFYLVEVLVNIHLYNCTNTTTAFCLLNSLIVSGVSLREMFHN